MTRTTIQAPVTKTAAFTGAAVAIAALTDAGMGPEIHIDLTNSGPDTIATFRLAVSTDATPFATTNRVIFARAFQVRATVDAPFSYVLKTEDIPLLKRLMGTTNLALRAELADIDGTSPTVTYGVNLITA